MRMLVEGVGILLLLLAGGFVTYHLYTDHTNYHNNMRLVELIRATVVEKHPELLEEQ